MIVTKTSHCSTLALLAIVTGCLVSTSEGFVTTVQSSATTLAPAPIWKVPGLRPRNRLTVSARRTNRLRLNDIVNQSPLMVVGGAATRKQVRTTLAGKILPVLKKFMIGPAMAKKIMQNILDITHWADLTILGSVALCAVPIARFTWEQFSDESDDRVYETTNRYMISSIISQFAKVALAVYAADVIQVIFSTIGLSWVDKMDLSGSFAKIAYTAWGVSKLLQLKTAALCKLLKQDEDNLGRYDIPNRIVNGLIVALASLLLFDWLSIKMGIAMRGVVAFGSVGTLAFTFASQGLLTQFMSGLFLIFSNKMYVGDYVRFGDDTSGVITKLGWMDTTLRQGDNTILKVPNAALATQKVSNVSRVRQSQVQQTLRLHYDDVDKIPLLIKTIKREIRTACPKLITDGTRPFSVYWTGFNEDHLEIKVNSHHNIAPLGDAYWKNRQAVLMAIAKACHHSNVQLAQMCSVIVPDKDPVWRTVPRRAYASGDSPQAIEQSMPDQPQQQRLIDWERWYVLDDEDDETDASRSKSGLMQSSPTKKKVRPSLWKRSSGTITGGGTTTSNNPLLSRHPSGHNTTNGPDISMIGNMPSANIPKWSLFDLWNKKQ